MSNIDYDDSIQRALGSLGSPDGSLGSGSAVAMSLSLAVESLALQLALSARRPAGTTETEYFACLSDQLAAWRAETRACFAEDPAHFGAVIETRRGRDAAGSDEDRIGHVENEMVHLMRANAVLLRLLAVSLPLGIESHRMLGDIGSTRGEAEAATAKHLAEAATSALTLMLASNCRTANRRRADYGIAVGELAAIRTVVGSLPVGAARTRLEEELGGAASDGVEMTEPGAS